MHSLHRKFPALGGSGHAQLFSSSQLSVSFQQKSASRNSLAMDSREGIEEVKRHDKVEELGLWNRCIDEAETANKFTYTLLLSYVFIITAKGAGKVW